MSSNSVQLCDSNGKIQLCDGNAKIQLCAICWLPYREYRIEFLIEDLATVWGEATDVYYSWAIYEYDDTANLDVVSCEFIGAGQTEVTATNKDGTPCVSPLAFTPPPVLFWSDIEEQWLLSVANFSDTGYIGYPVPCGVNRDDPTGTFIYRVAENIEENLGEGGKLGVNCDWDEGSEFRRDRATVTISEVAP